MEVIMKPTEACNGTCVYCSAAATIDRRQILPRERLGTLFERFAEWLRQDNRRTVGFCWHGGEPMLCGIEYYASVVSEQQKAFGSDLQRVRNTMQSNLSLLTEKWIPCLQQLLRGRPIGTSYDIVEGIRGLTGGQALSESWLRAVRLLRANRIPVGVVYVVHTQSLERARDLYYFFGNLDPSIGVRYNPLYREGRGDSSDSRALWVTASEYGQFLIDICDVWLKDMRGTSITPIKEWYDAWHGKFHLCCDSRGNCHKTHLGINPNGDVYGCGRGSDSGQHRLGNISDDEVEDLLNHPVRVPYLASRARLLREGHCRDCRYWSLCHGGCPAMAQLYHGDPLRETYFCAARKRFFLHLEELLGPPRGSRNAPSERGADRRTHVA